MIKIFFVRIQKGPHSGVLLTRVTLIQ